MTFASHLAAAAAVLACATPALASTILVPATGDIFLASQPAATSVSGYFGTDTAPAASPVSITLMGHDLLTFAASGSASVDGSCFAGPNGGCFTEGPGEEPSPASGTYVGPATALIGVFLPSGVTSVANGPGANYTTLVSQDHAVSYPGLNQIFFIGTGSTTGAVVKDFYAPAGAVTLYLAVDDAIGASGNNAGSFQVDYTDAVAPAPEPGAWTLMLIGFAALGAAVRRRRLQPA